MSKTSNLEPSGHCLICGKSVAGQSHCDACSDAPDVYMCPECLNDVDSADCRNEDEPKSCLDHMDKDELYDECKRLRKILAEQVEILDQIIKRAKE